ncbi:MAG TPA: hypothetical protein PK970_14090 [Hyphomicrobiaceae bacterium]|nr:hypothetical protein [Hyphomicrobiaceae bacterium]
MSRRILERLAGASVRLSSPGPVPVRPASASPEYMPWRQALN